MIAENKKEFAALGVMVRGGTVNNAWDSVGRTGAATTALGIGAQSAAGNP
jgi:hypothetical protein